MRVKGQNMEFSGSKGNHSQGLLIFNLGARQSFAIGTLKVRELVPFQPLSAIPQSSPAILGAMNFRGTTIAVVDLSAAIGCAPTPEADLQRSFIIVTDCQRKVTGFLVHSISSIVECDWKSITPPPKALGKNTFITGVTRINDRLIQLVDIELLLARTFHDDSGKRAAITDVQRESLRQRRILLVDDSSTARKQMADSLQELNVPFEVLTNGQEALDLMIQASQQGRPVNLLVSDIEMPGLDGYELTFAIRNNSALKDVYIILHSSLSSEISVSQAMQVGANEALTKFDVEELVNAMLRGAENSGAVIVDQPDI